MEIDAQHMDEFLRIQRQQSTPTNRMQTPASAGSFDQILTEALTLQEATQQQPATTLIAPRVGQSGMISQMLLNPLEQNQTEDSESALLENAFNGASGTLDLWDTYAQKLSASPDSNSLRDAYSILQHIDTQIAQLKSNQASLRNADSGLNSLINELEILSTAEKVKFNRGDYA